MNTPPLPPTVWTLKCKILKVTRWQHAACRVMRNMNGILVNCSFAPSAFAEAVAPLKQSAVSSGHCGFCPLRQVHPLPPKNIPRASFIVQLRLSFRACQWCPMNRLFCLGFASREGQSKMASEKEHVSNQFKGSVFRRSSLAKQQITPPLSLRWHWAQAWRLLPCPD